MRLVGRQLRWLAANPERGSDVLEGVVRLLSGSAQRLQRRSWRSMAGCGCEGRYVPDTAMVDTANQQAELRAAAAQGFEAWLRAKISAAADTEINVELGEFTIKSSRAMLTPVHMGDFDDYRQLFGPMDAARRPQCALVSSSAERQQVLTRTRTLTLTRALALALTLALALALTLTLTRCGCTSTSTTRSTGSRRAGPCAGESTRCV